MKKCVIEPDGWECTLAECPPGFFMYGNDLCFKSEYGTDKGHAEAFGASGEYFVLGDEIIVQPVHYQWEED